MRRLLRVLLPAIMLVPVIAIGSPASATLPDPPLCTGAYTFNLSSPMTLPGVGPSTSVGFSMYPTGAFCTGSTSWSANYPSGSLTGWCGAATGWGYLPDGRSFDVVWAGGSLTIVGGPAGTYAVIPTSVDCAGSGGTSFIAVGAVSATADACAGNGTMNMSPQLSGGGTVSFSVGFVLGACAATFLNGFYASGTLTGTCASASGSGSAGGTPFDVTWVGNPGLQGGRLLFTGNVIGVIHAMPVPGTGGGCGYHFVAQGQVAKFR